MLVDSTRHETANRQKLRVPTRTVAIDKVKRFSLDSRDEPSSQMTGKRSCLMRAEPDEHAALCVQAGHEPIKQNSHMRVDVGRSRLRCVRSVELVLAHVHNVERHALRQALLCASFNLPRE